MSEGTPPRGGSPSPAGGSPRTPRGARLRDRVSFFENVWSSSRPNLSADELDEPNSNIIHPRSLSRASDSSFEESFERLVEEGDYNGAKLVKFEKITVRKSVRELTSTSVMSVRTGELPTELSRTPSEEHALEDSAYQSHGIHSHGSKSSSTMSLARFPSEENISQKRLSSSQLANVTDDKPASEWYAEYHNQSFQNVSARMDYVRSRSQYDAHIAEIRGLL